MICQTGVILLLVLVAHPAGAQIVPATGTTTAEFSSFSGTMSGVNVDIDGSSVPSGTISFTLDPSFGAENYCLFNWDTDFSYLQLNLLLSSPLTESLDLAPVPIEIDESGPLDSTPMIDLTTGTLAAPWSDTVTLTGGGTVHGGLFDGSVYQNKEEFHFYVVGKQVVNISDKLYLIKDAGISVASTQDGTIDGDATSGTGSGTITGVPEPSTLTLLGIGLSLVGYVGRRRTAKA